DGLADPAQVGPLERDLGADQVGLDLQVWQGQARVYQVGDNISLRSSRWLLVVTRRKAGRRDAGPLVTSRPLGPDPLVAKVVRHSSRAAGGLPRINPPDFRRLGIPVLPYEPGVCGHTTAPVHLPPTIKAQAPAKYVDPLQEAFPQKAGS